MASNMDYLKKRYKKMSAAQLELIIKQIDHELEHHPEADREELRMATRILEEKIRDARKEKKGRPCLPTRMEHQIDVGEEF